MPTTRYPRLGRFVARSDCSITAGSSRTTAFCPSSTLSVPTASSLKMDTFLPWAFCPTFAFFRPWQNIRPRPWIWVYRSHSHVLGSFNDIYVRKLEAFAVFKKPLPSASTSAGDPTILIVTRLRLIGAARASIWESSFGSAPIPP